MAENKMAQVAAIFGKKLGEEFWVKLKMPKNDSIIKCRFDENGVAFYSEIFEKWQYPISLLELILTGEVEIVEDE